MNQVRAALPDWKTQWRDLAPKFGRSGCKLVDTGSAVLKIAPPGKQAYRLACQASYMMLHENTGVMPRVYAQGDGWCLMEKLQPYDSAAGPLGALTALASLWENEAEPGDDGWTSEVYAYAAARAPDLASHLVPHLVHNASPWVVTHGDPTLDNLMARWHEPVFIDPLPPERHTPNLRALDIGKVLMSLNGWHEAEYGGSEVLDSWRLAVKVCVIDMMRDAREARLAWAFAVYHMIRALPYARNRQGVYLAARAIIEEHLT